MSTDTHDDLTPRQRRFVEEYLVDLNATQAAIRAGYSPKTARVIAAENLAKPAIAEAIIEAKAARSVATRVTAERVVEELARLAFFDIGKLFHEQGGLKPFHEMDEDTRRAIVAHDVEMLREEGEQVGTIRKVKMADKLGALNTLAKHTGVDPQKVKLGVDPDDPLGALLRSIQGSALPIKGSPLNRAAND